MRLQAVWEMSGRTPGWTDRYTNGLQGVINIALKSVYSYSWKTLIFEKKRKIYILRLYIVGLNCFNNSESMPFCVLYICWRISRSMMFKMGPSQKNSWTVPPLLKSRIILHLLDHIQIFQIYSDDPNSISNTTAVTKK